MLSMEILSFTTRCVGFLENRREGRAARGKAILCDKKLISDLECTVDVTAVSMTYI